MEIIGSCDYRVAAAESYIGLVEVGVGLIPGAGGNLRMLSNLSKKIKLRGFSEATRTAIGMDRAAIQPKFKNKYWIFFRIGLDHQFNWFHRISKILSTISFLVLL